MRRRAHDTSAAAGYVVLAVLLFSFVDAMSKYLATRYSVTFLVGARYALQALLLLAWWGPSMRGRLFAARHPGLQVVRGLMLIASSALVVLAFRHLPLAEATAINYSTPVIVTVLAVLLLDERLTRPRLAFVVAGVIGVALIVRPGTSVFQGAAVFPLAAALCGACYQVLTSRLAEEDARVMLFYGSLVGALTLGLVWPWAGIPAGLSWFDALLVVALGVVGTAGHFLFIVAFQRAPASTVTPFTYVQLVFATLIGWWIFGDLPDRWTFVGMGVIAVSGAVLVWYERRTALGRIPEPPAVE